MKSCNFVAAIVMALSGCAHTCVDVEEPHPIDVSNAGEGDVPYSHDRKIAGHFAIVFDDSIKKRANFEQQYDRKLERRGSRRDSHIGYWTLKLPAEGAVVTSFRQLFSGLFERTTDYATVPSATIMQQQALRGALVVELTRFDVTFKYTGRRKWFPLIKYEYIGITRASFRISVSGMQGGPMEIVASAVGTGSEWYTDFSGPFMPHFGCRYESLVVAAAMSRSIEDAIRQVLVQVSKQISESPALQSTKAMQGGSPSLKHGFRLEDRPAPSANVCSWPQGAIRGRSPIRG